MSSAAESPANPERIVLRHSRVLSSKVLTAGFINALFARFFRDGTASAVPIDLRQMLASAPEASLSYG